MRLSGNGVEFNHASDIFQELTHAVKASGLEDALSEYVIGSSGGDANFSACCQMAPAKAKVVGNPEDGVAELPTLALLQDWAAKNTGHVIYIHGKGSLHSGPTKPTWAAWRRCMSNVVIWNWQSCMKDLSDGFDCAGPHWLTPERYRGIVGSPYFGGNFWTAHTRHLRRLPKIDIHASRYEAEAWIGRTKRKIACRPYASHFPMTHCQ